MTSLTTSSGAIVQGGREYGAGHCLGEEAAIAWCSRIEVFFQDNRTSVTFSSGRLLHRCDQERGAS